MTSFQWRREWGAVTFVLTVLLGALVIPIALYFGNHGAAGSTLPASALASSPRAASSAAVSTPASAAR
ncbi:MAG TPA: hypothetical protein VNI34_00885 [Candidatus Nitrosotalea sp.]|nr:hypothetical protein [Candidatus Nitrosotalea sp.]